MSRGWGRIRFVAVLCAAWFVAAAARAEAVEWERYAGEGNVTVVTTNEDGSSRETTIWLVVVDGQGYIRTGGTRWGRNVERDPNVTLRIVGTDIPLTAQFVTDEAERDKIGAAFRKKYGFMDALTGLVRGTPKIMRLLPRADESLP